MLLIEFIIYDKDYSHQVYSSDIGKSFSSCFLGTILLLSKKSSFFEISSPLKSELFRYFS